MCHGCLVRFFNYTNYVSLFALELDKLLVNDKIIASCQTNISPKHCIKGYRQQK